MLRSINIIPVAGIQKQIMSNWCWAVCSLYVCEFYGTLNGRTQRKFVADTLNKPFCANPFPNPDCNRTLTLDHVFNLIGHLAPNQPIVGPLTEAELINHFTLSSRPIGCQIVFPDFGHAVIIAGVRSDENRLFVVVADPGSGTINTVPYPQFRNNYLNREGRWTRTYLTRQKTHA